MERDAIQATNAERRQPVIVLEPAELPLDGSAAPVSSPTNATAASFGFNAPSDPDAGFDCRLDRPGLPGTYSPCGSPFDKNESYSGSQRTGRTRSPCARDPSGNVDGTPASRTWTIDTVAPVVTLTGGPAQGSHTKQFSPGAGNVDATPAAYTWSIRR